MSTRGFNYKKRRDWPARGARREWPPLNVQETDPSLVVNQQLTGLGAGQLTWIAITASAQTIPNNANTTIASANWVVDDASGTADALSHDYPSTAWLSAGTNSFRLPRAGNFAIVARAVWDANTTGTRSLTVDTLVMAGEDNTTTDSAADVVFAGNPDHTVANIGYTAGGEFVHIDAFQDSGGSRTCTFHVFIAYVSTAGAAGGTGGGGGSATLQETWAVLVNGSNQAISSGGGFSTLTEAGLTMSVTAESSDFAAGSWLGGGGTLRFPRDGQVTVASNVGWDTNTVGDRVLDATIGATYPGSYSVNNSAAELINTINTTANQTVTAVGSVSAGDSFALQVWQDSGGNRNVSDVFIWVLYTPILA